MNASHLLQFKKSYSPQIFKKKHLKESGMACTKHMASLIENRKCNFYLIYIHVGEVKM
jgi:hypothetical protein